MLNSLVFYLIGASTALFVVLAFFIVMGVIMSNKRVQKLNLEKQKLQFDLENKELSMGFSERELILNEISKEIHDSMGQIANMIRMNLYSIEEYCTNDAQLQVIQYVVTLAETMIKDARHISHSLNSNMIKNKGLQVMLESDLEQLHLSRQLICNLEVKGDNKCISAESQLLSYRIAQEAIHNIIQHANASKINVSLYYDLTGLTMMITDNGIGFEKFAINSEETMGLQNMLHRARLLNGDLKIESSTGQGCTVMLFCPCR